MRFLRLANFLCLIFFFFAALMPSSKFFMSTEPLRGNMHFTWRIGRDLTKKDVKKLHISGELASISRVDDPSLNSRKWCLSLRFAGWTTDRFDEPDTIHICSLECRLDRWSDRWSNRRDEDYSQLLSRTLINSLVGPTVWLTNQKPSRLMSFCQTFIEQLWSVLMMNFDR